MFKYIVETFKEKYSDIMNGEYGHNGLLDNCKVKGLIRELKYLTQKYYFADKEVLTLELVGDTVISGLLDMFVKELVK